MPCLSDLVVERINTSNAPYSQNEQQKESSFLKEFYEYQKKQQEELAAYSQTSAVDINKASVAGRYLVQPAANTNSINNNDAGLLAANPSSSKDVSYENWKTRDVQLSTKEYNLKTQDVTLEQPEYHLKTQNINLDYPKYNLKTASITLTDISDIYKALTTRTVPASEYTFSKQYGDLLTFSLGTLFSQGVGMYANWHTSPIAITTGSGSKERLYAEKSNVVIYDVVASNQYNTQYDYYSLAYDKRSTVSPTGLIGAIYNNIGYSYENTLKAAIESSDGTDIIYSNMPANNSSIYTPFQLTDEAWSLSSTKLPTEANLSLVGIYNPVGAWQADEQAFFHRIPLLGDLQQKLSDLEGSSILWQAFYNKKSTDPLQIYKLANVNTNVIYMTGRFIPQPPIANDIRFVSDMVPSALGGKVAGAVGDLMGGIPTYPYIPLPYAMPQYKMFSGSQLPENILDIDYPYYLKDEQMDLFHFGGEQALAHSRKLGFTETIKKSKTQFVTALAWDATAISQEMQHYHSGGWEPLGDLKNNDYFNADAQYSHVPSYYPSEFGYDELQDFEGRVSIYDLQIQKPSGADANQPEFMCQSEGTMQGRSLATLTTITSIPDVELKNNITYPMGEFGSFLLYMNYQNYISSIQTKTIETAECDCYHWGKDFIEYFYGSGSPSKYRHRSLYKSYYNIIISKICFIKNSSVPIQRLIMQRMFYGVPSFNLTETIQENKLQEIPITWNIIGQNDNMLVYQQNILNSDVFESVKTQQQIWTSYGTNSVSSARA